MKLNKETKTTIKEGDVLTKGSETYTVETVIANGNRMNITVADEYGRRIYLAPSSMFYGFEIIEQNKEENTMKTYNVSFEYAEGIYCSNLAKAECLEDVESHYSKYAWVKVSEASEGDLREAERKGKPIVECPHIEEPEPEIDPQVKKDQIESIIESMPEEEQIALHNEIETACNGEFQIYSMADFDDIMSGLRPAEIAQKVLFGNFRWGCKYFQFDGYDNLTSFDSPNDYNARFYPSDLAEEIVLSGNAYGHESIQAVLDED